MPSHVFLFGLPFVGKTTALQRIVESVPALWSGFVTLPVTSQNRKTGLKMVAHDGSSFNVASKAPGGSHRNSTYALDGVTLDLAMKTCFSGLGSRSFVYMDEINSLFCRSVSFCAETARLMNAFPVVAVVPRKGHKFLGELWRRPDVTAFEVHSQNRDDIPGVVRNFLKSKHE